MDMDSKTAVKYLAGPVIVAHGGWSVDVPMWMIEQARRERLDVLAGNLPGHIVSPTEIAVFTLAASMAMPLDRQAAEIHLWACTRAISRRLGMDGDIALDDRNCTDADVLSPDGRLHREYSRMAHQILETIIKSAKTRTKKHPKEINPMTPELVGLVEEMVDVRSLCGDEREHLRQWQTDNNRKLTIEERNHVQDLLEARWREAQRGAGVRNPLSAEDRRQASAMLENEQSLGI
jgi:hypothetical protein